MAAINNYISNEKNEFTKVKLDFSYKTIKRVDELIEYHNSVKSNNNSEILINIYGLLQSLFVSIDALYTLTLTITNSKNYININKNEHLNRLKFIRNDVVGHPINRKYKDRSIGYGLIDLDDITNNKFKFDIFVNNSNKKMYKREEVINLNELKTNYLNEKEKVINKLNKYINVKIYPTNLDLLINNLYRNFNEENLSFVKSVYKTNYNNEGDRFLWRVELLEVLLNFKTTNDDFKEVLSYSITYQINKLINIINEIENRKIKTKEINTPKMLNEIFNELNNNTDFLNYIKDIQDYNNPKFQYNINYLLNNTTNKYFKYYLNKLKNETNRSKIYLIGSILNNYYKNML